MTEGSGLEGQGAATAAPGWYPAEDGSTRWWDGTQWTAAAPANTQVATQGAQGWEQDKTVALLAHLLPIVTGILGPIILYVMVKDDSTKSEWVKRHALESLNFNISLMIYGTVGFIIGIILSIVTLGLFLIVLIPLALIFAIGAFILAIIAAMASNNGEDYTYPLTLRLVKG